MRENLFYLPSLLIRRSEIALEAGHPDQALADAERTLQELQRSVPAGTLSSVMGKSYLMLGRALRAQGKHAQAHTTLESALKHLEGTLGSHHAETRNARQLLAGDIQSR